MFLNDCTRLENKYKWKLPYTFCFYAIYKKRGLKEMKVYTTKIKGNNYIKIWDVPYEIDFDDSQNKEAEIKFNKLDITLFRDVHPKDFEGINSLRFYLNDTRPFAESFTIEKKSNNYLVELIFFGNNDSKFRRERIFGLWDTTIFLDSLMKQFELDQVVEDVSFTDSIDLGDGFYFSFTMTISNEIDIYTSINESQKKLDDAIERVRESLEINAFDYIDEFYIKAPQEFIYPIRQYLIYFEKFMLDRYNVNISLTTKKINNGIVIKIKSDDNISNSKLSLYLAEFCNYPQIGVSVFSELFVKKDELETNLSELNYQVDFLKGSLMAMVNDSQRLDKIIQNSLLISKSDLISIDKKDNLKYLISENKFTETFNILSKEKLNLDNYNALIVLKSQFTDIKQKMRLRTIPDESARIALNSIAYRLLNFIDDM